MNSRTFLGLRQRVVDAGYGEEIVRSESQRPCQSADEFFTEYVWVVISSGMKNQVAELIFGRVRDAIAEGVPILDVFGHRGKVAAIETVMGDRERLYTAYQQAVCPVAYLRMLPWIGDITKWHLAKNLGIDTPKPDRHLVRIAAKHGVDCFELCRSLAGATGYRVASVDLIIWRAANLGFV